jgi:hypothetical protein
MARLRIAAGVVLLSTIASTPVLAQLSEPAAYEAEHPDRDILNGGALTPAARAAAGLDNPRDAYGTAGGVSSVPARATHVRIRRHR